MWFFDTLTVIFLAIIFHSLNIVQEFFSPSLEHAILKHSDPILLILYRFELIAAQLPNKTLHAFVPEVIG